MKIGDIVIPVDGSYTMRKIGIDKYEDVSGLKINGREWEVVATGKGFPTGNMSLGGQPDILNNLVIYDGKDIVYIRDSFVKPAKDEIREAALNKAYERGKKDGQRISKVEIYKAYNTGRRIGIEETTIVKTREFEKEQSEKIDKAYEEGRVVGRKESMIQPSVEAVYQWGYNEGKVEGKEKGGEDMKQVLIVRLKGCLCFDNSCTICLGIKEAIEKIEKLE